MIVLAQAAVVAATLGDSASGRPERERPLDAPAAAVAPSADPWLGGDKVKHFVLAGFVESAGFAAARAAGADRRPALVAAAFAAAGASIGKELLDRRAGRRVSARDLVWDLAGMAAYGVVLARTSP